MLHQSHFQFHLVDQQSDKKTKQNADFEKQKYAEYQLK